MKRTLHPRYTNHAKKERPTLLGLEGLEEAELERFRVRYEELARAAREALRRGELDTGTPEVRPD
jgi:hypothetical protein